MASEQEGPGRDERLGEALADFLEAVERGGEPDRAGLLARYPELAAELGEFFADWDRFDEAAVPLRSTTSWGPIETAGVREAPGVVAGEAGRAFGEYELLQEIGEGGMGVVYRARHAGLGRVVALKMIRAGHLA